jgi:hypothetical protein
MQGDLSKKTLEELIELGVRMRLLDGWKITGDTAHFQVGSVNVDLRAESAHAFVRGLIRGHEKAQQLAQNGGILED